MKSKVLIALLAFTVLLAVFNVSSFAAAHSVDSADISAKLNSDGSVNVTEVWNVTYFSVEPGFERRIDAEELNALEKYTDLTDFSVSVDGVPAAENSSGAGTFSVVYEEGSPYYAVVIDNPAESKSVEYTVSYKINGAVKKGKADGAEKAMFGFAFIGESMGTVNNVTVSIDLPSDVAAEDIVIPDDARNHLRDVKTGNVIFSSADSSGQEMLSGKLAVALYAPISDFDGDALPRYSASADSIKRIGSILRKYVLPPVCAVIFVFGVIYLILFMYKRKISAVYKRTKRDLDVKTDDPVNIPASLTPVEAYRYMTPYPRRTPKKMTRKLPYLFGLAILECIDAGYITAGKGALKIDFIPDGAPEYQKSVLGFLRHFTDKSTSESVINSVFLDAVKSECNLNYDYMVNYMTAFYKLTPDMPKGFLKDANNAAVFVDSNKARIFAERGSKLKSYSDAVNAVLGGTSVRSAEVFSVMYNAAGMSKFFAASGDDSVSALSNALGCISDVLIKSK
ncbi:MAG: DUF2207 domain-containing protein [Clostridia bacterium]|nr:DUF2207 domain-containing protein [Clostridia bacterium]